jgi:hypothetical protein
MHVAPHEIKAHMRPVFFVLMLDMPLAYSTKYLNLATEII